MLVPPTVAHKKLLAVLATTSRNAVASRIHVTPDTLRKIELGISRPGSATIEKMRALEIQPLDWFTRIAESAEADRTAPPSSTPVPGSGGASQ